MLWDRSRDAYFSSLESIGNVVRLLIDRINAEIDDQSLEACFAVFDIASCLHWECTWLYGRLLLLS